MNQLALGALLAEGPVNTGPDFGKASPVGLVIVVLLLIAVLLLGWSMSRQLKKVPKSFDDPGPAAEPADGATAAAAETASEPSGRAPEAGTESSTGESSS